jgi:hypothetical protein
MALRRPCPNDLENLGTFPHPARMTGMDDEAGSMAAPGDVGARPARRRALKAIVAARPGFLERAQVLPDVRHLHGPEDLT